MQRYVPPCLTVTPDARANRVGEADVHHQAVAEEGGDAAAGAVEELVGDDEFLRTMLLFERADGRKRENARHSELLHAVNVGAEVELRGRDAVSAAMAREKSDVAAGEGADHVVVGGLAEGGENGGFFVGFEAGHVVETAAADDSDFRFHWECSWMSSSKTPPVEAGWTKT